MGGQRVARRDVSGSVVHYYFADHLGSTGVVTNSAGTVPFDADLDYYPYGGIVTGSPENVPQNYKFNGKERDAESQLDNFGARYNASSLGRFMTPDWSARPTAVPYAVFGDPQSLNLYTYVRNDPVSRGDADGHTLDDRALPVASHFAEGTYEGGPSADDYMTFLSAVQGVKSAQEALAKGRGAQAQPTQQPTAQNPSLTVTTSPGAENTCGLSFPAGGTDIGPVTSEGRGWFYNVLLTGNLPEGSDASKYGIEQTYKDKTSGKTDDGKSFKANSSGKETVAPNGSWATTKGSTIFAADSPGPHNSVGGEFVDSVTSNIQFKSWIVDAKGKQVSPAVNWSIRIVVVGGQLKTATAGVK